MKYGLHVTFLHKENLLENQIYNWENPTALLQIMGIKLFSWHTSGYMYFYKGVS